MATEQIRMSGEELEKVWERSGLQVKDIEPRLGISQATYYNYIKMEKIPQKVEDRIDKDSQLAVVKNRELSKTDQEPAIRPTELIKFINDTFMLMKDQAVSMGKAVEGLTDDNKLLRRIVEGGLDSGSLGWKKQAS